MRKKKNCKKLSSNKGLKLSIDFQHNLQSVSLSSHSKLHVKSGVPSLMVFPESVWKLLTLPTMLASSSIVQHVICPFSSTSLLGTLSTNHFTWSHTLLQR